MKLPRVFRCTTAHGAEILVRWMPDGLDIHIDGKNAAWEEEEARSIEFAFPARDEDKLCPMAAYKGPRR